MDKTCNTTFLFEIALEVQMINYLCYAEQLPGTPLSLAAIKKKENYLEAVVKVIYLGSII